MSVPEGADAATAERITVLHVDDDPEFVEVAGDLLEREDDGIEVLTAVGASAALDRLEDADVDCVVSDHDMPEMDGLELLEAVRERDADLPFILFTGKGSEAVASEAISAGVTDYLQKGTGTDQYTILANRIRNAVDASRSVARSRRRNHRLEQILKIVPTGVFQVDRDGRIVFANDRADTDDGASQVVRPEPTDGWELRTPDGEPVPGSARPFQRTLDTGEPVDGRQYTAVSPDDDRRAYEASSAPLFDDGGIVDSVVFAVTDVTERRERERRFRRTTEQLELILDNAPLIVAALDEDGVFRLSRGRGLSKLGLEPGEVVGQSVFDVYDDFPAIKTQCRRALDGERIQTTAEVGGRTFDVWYEPVEDAGATPYSVVLVGVDITDRRMRERDLERYETVVEASGDPVYALDASGTITFANDALVEMTGYERERLLGNHISTIMDEADVAEGDDLIASLLSDERDRGTFEMDVRTADGDAIPCENHVALLTREDSFGGTVGVIRDITERKRHEWTLEALNRVAQAIQDEDTVEGVCERTVTTAERLLDFNMCSILYREGDWLVPYARSSGAAADAVRRMRTDQGLAGKTYQNRESYVVDDAEADTETDPAKPTHRSGLSVPIGRYGVFQAVDTTRAAFDERDRTLAELLATHAATALERIEREADLTSQNDRLEEFVSLLSHDVRNPLNLAAGHLELARAETDSEHLDEVARAHERIEQLVDNMLALAREQDHVDSLESVDLREVVEETWADIGVDGAALSIETDATVRADRSRLRQIVENLLRNAVEHGSTAATPEGGGDAVEGGGLDVRITVGDLPDGFYVEDDGPGVPADERRAVFESGYSTGENGTGFGLRIVEGTASAHGWSVSITEGSDGGARFEVTGVDRL